MELANCEWGEGEWAKSTCNIVVVQLTPMNYGDWHGVSRNSTQTAVAR
jgi:hypothetical protein